MPQTSYNVNPEIAQEGLIVSSPAGGSVSVSLSQTASMTPGLFVIYKGSVTADGIMEVTNPALATDITDGLKTAGILGFSQSEEEPDDLVQDAIGLLLRSGLIWVRSESAFTPGGDVYVRFNPAGGGLVRGRIGGSPNVDSALLANARWLSGGVAEGLGLIEWPKSA